MNRNDALFFFKLIVSLRSSCLSGRIKLTLKQVWCFFCFLKGLLWLWPESDSAGGVQHSNHLFPCELFKFCPLWTFLTWDLWNCSSRFQTQRQAQREELFCCSTFWGGSCAALFLLFNVLLTRLLQDEMNKSITFSPFVVWFEQMNRPHRAVTGARCQQHDGKCL